MPTPKYTVTSQTQVDELLSIHALTPQDGETVLQWLKCLQSTGCLSGDPAKHSRILAVMSAFMEYR